jgi:lipoate-protein ligase A
MRMPADGGVFLRTQRTQKRKSTQSIEGLSSRESEATEGPTHRVSLPLEQAPRVARGDEGLSADFPPSSPSWYLWLDIARRGYLNMAIDQALLERAGRFGERWLRLYRWQPHCLSFGRHEPASRRYDPVRIAARGLDAVRRPTGGRAVWHGREVTYAIAAPTNALGPLRQAYLEIHQMLLQALQALGAPASMAPPRPPAKLDAGACFAQPVGGEIMIAGKKVVGSAQLREGEALLQHGSILLHDDQVVVQSITRHGPSAEGVELAPEGTELGIADRAIVEAIADAAAARWSGRWDQQPPIQPVMELATTHVPRFRSEAWTWRM